LKFLILAIGSFENFVPTPDTVVLGAVCGNVSTMYNSTRALIKTRLIYLVLLFGSKLDNNEDEDEDEEKKSK